MLDNFFRINLPYGLIRNDKNEWACFNREYQPLGHNKISGNSIWGKDNGLVFTKYKKMTEKFISEIANTAKCDDAGKIHIFFLYDDASNPTNRSNKMRKKLWEMYFEKLKQLSLLKEGSGIL